MLSKYLLPSLAVLGVGFAISTIASGSRPPEIARPVAEPARASFTKFIAGSGIVEPSSKTIAIGSPLSRCVAQVLARVGDDVAEGTPLFRLDDRDLRGELSIRLTARATARARLERLLSLPRAEDLPPAKARVAEAEARLADASNLLALAEGVSDVRAISREEVERRRHEVEAARARLDGARGELASLVAAASSVRATEIELDRLVVRAPIAGTILQVNVRRGEFAPAGALETPLMLIGDLDPLHVRVDVDENDAWRFRPGAPATASIRGNGGIGAQLRFEYVEPYVVPKRSLTGDTSERVDTRVMQVVYAFERGELPIQVGQLMDVFIEVDGVPAADAEIATVAR